VVYLKLTKKYMPHGTSHLAILFILPEKQYIVETGMKFAGI
jgi:hypothetical protein